MIDNIRRNHGFLWPCGIQGGNVQLGRFSHADENRKWDEALTAIAYLVASPILEDGLLCHL